MLCRDGTTCAASAKAAWVANAPRSHSIDEAPGSTRSAQCSRSEEGDVLVESPQSSRPVRVAACSRSRPMSRCCRVVSATALATLSFLLPRVAFGQRAHIRTDSVLLARDIDRSGATDYVVSETRTGVSLLPERRIAIYLDMAPETRKPRWATPWSDEADIALSESHALSTNAWLITIDGEAGDAGWTLLLVVTRGHVREDMSFDSGYGEGFLDLREERGRHVAEASLEHVKLRGKRVTTQRDCKSPMIAAMRFVFDTGQQQYVQEGPYCALPH